jgi:hypothetical protein
VSAGAAKRFCRCLTCCHRDTGKRAETGEGKEQLESFERVCLRRCRSDARLRSLVPIRDALD